MQHFFLYRHGFALGNDQRALPNMLALPAPKDVSEKAKLNLSSAKIPHRSHTDSCQSQLPLNLLQSVAPMAWMCTATTSCQADRQGQRGPTNQCLLPKMTQMRYPSFYLIVHLTYLGCTIDESIPCVLVHSIIFST